MQRVCLVLSLALFTGCPVVDEGKPFVEGGSGKAQDNSAAARDCIDVSECTVKFRYPADGASRVELRGDFRADGWGNGIELVRNGDWFEAEVPVADGRDIHYKLVVDGDWIADPGAELTAPDGLGGENSVKRVRCDACSQEPYDWRDAIMYFVFVDRFVDGDPGNNMSVPGTLPAADYAGGDFAGVLQKLQDGYFEGLGVDVLWLTAPFDNAEAAGIGNDNQMYSAYHGYWPRDLETVESRLGDLETLQAVVDEAHSRGIRVILDYVMNHVHEESPVYRDHPDWFWPLALDDGESCVCGEGCSWGGDEGRRCWFRSYLPDFDFTNPEARAYSVNNAIDWIKKTGVDGYRLDAVKHIEDRWIRDLREQLRIHVEREGETFYLVGETFDGDPGLIGSYVHPDVLLNGQFDFPLRARVASKVLRRDGTMEELAEFLEENDEVYHPGSVMGTFVGNHDLPRSIHLAEEEPLFGEWDSGKSRSWENLPELPSDRAAFERLALAYGFILTTPGVPLIYYGDEYGMAGGGDPDNRRLMQWDGHSDPQLWLRDELAALSLVRRGSAALRRGTRTTLGSSDDVLSYRMSGGGETVIVSINRADGARAAAGVPAGTYRDLKTGEEFTAPGTVPARSMRILELVE